MSLAHSGVNMSVSYPPDGAVILALLISRTPFAPPGPDLTLLMARMKDTRELISCHSWPNAHCYWCVDAGAQLEGVVVIRETRDYA